MRKSLILTVLTLTVLIPGTLFLGTRLSGRGYYVTATLVILETMLPFFLAFETRKPQPRELVTISVLSALAVASRVAVPVPHFKPVTAVIMLAGIAMGPEAGFVIGAVTAFASNFFLSQGPWTPWQMMAYGTGGFLAGLCFYRRKRPAPAVLAGFGFFLILLVVGPLLDCSTLFTTGARLSWKFAAAVFAAGFPNNLQHALACGLTMLLFSAPLLGKLDRLITKYGMMDVRQEPK